MSEYIVTCSGCGKTVSGEGSTPTRRKCVDLGWANAETRGRERCDECGRRPRRPPPTAAKHHVLECEGCDARLEGVGVLAMKVAARSLGWGISEVMTPRATIVRCPSCRERIRRAHIEDVKEQMNDLAETIRNAPPRPARIMPVVLHGEACAPCCRCGAMKPLGQFSRCAQKANGRQSYCKACDHEDYLERKQAAKAACAPGT